MTKALKDWLARIPGERYMFIKRDAKVWAVELWDEDGDEWIARGEGSTPDAAELAALEDYALRTFVPGALDHGRKMLGLR